MHLSFPGHKDENVSVAPQAAAETPVAPQEAWDNFAKSADAAKAPDEVIVGNPEAIRAKQDIAKDLGEAVTTPEVVVEQSAAGNLAPVTEIPAVASPEAQTVTPTEPSVDTPEHIPTA